MEVSDCRAPIPALDPATKREWKRSMYEAQSGRCWYCGVIMDYYDLAPPHHTTSPDFATIEHLAPVRRRIRGESGRLIGYHPDTPSYVLRRENLVLACLWCNTHRMTLPITDFIGRLRNSGKRLGIVSRIQHLVNDHMPAPDLASDFEWYLLQALVHPRRPADSLKRLPAALEAAVLPDPAPSVTIRQIITESQPAPKRMAPPLVVRFFRALWRCTRRLPRVPRGKEAVCR